jgi:integrase
MASRHKGTVRQRTRERYEQLVRVHIKPSLGQKKPKDLSRGHVEIFYGEKGEALSTRTVQYVHVTLHKALKDAGADELIHRNVSDGLKPSSSRRHEIHPLTPEQTKTLLCAARETQHRTLYVLAIHYGLRKGELLGSKWQDVDLGAGVMQVRRTMSESRVGTIGEATKGGRGRRVELSQMPTEALLNHRERQGGGQGLVFATVNGMPVTGTNLTRSFNALLKRAGLP